MLAAVLWLGNVSFTVIDNENHVEAVADEGENLSADDALDILLRLLCIIYGSFALSLELQILEILELFFPVNHVGQIWLMIVPLHI